MDVYQIRKQNLAWLCEKLGKQTVALRLGYEDMNYINVLLSVNTKTNIGNKVAAKIESTFKEVSSAVGWMSSPQWTETAHDDAKREIDQMSEAEVAVALKLLRALSNNPSE